MASACVCIRYDCWWWRWIRANVKQPIPVSVVLASIGWRYAARASRAPVKSLRYLWRLIIDILPLYPPLSPPLSKQKLLTSWKIMAALKSISLPDIFAPCKFTLLLPRYLFIFIAAIGLLSYRHWQRRMHCKSRVYGANHSIALLLLLALRVYLSHGSRSPILSHLPPTGGGGGMMMRNFSERTGETGRARARATSSRTNETRDGSGGGI